MGVAAGLDLVVLGEGRTRFFALSAAGSSRRRFAGALGPGVAGSGLKLLFLGVAWDLRVREL